MKALERKISFLKSPMQGPNRNKLYEMTKVQSQADLGESGKCQGLSAISLVPQVWSDIWDDEEK